MNDGAVMGFGLAAVSAANLGLVDDGWTPDWYNGFVALAVMFATIAIVEILL